MPSTNKTLQSALIHHQAGRFAEAEKLYRAILAEIPAHSDALHLLGLAVHQLGRNEEAIQHISRAISIDATNAFFYSNLGAVQYAQGRYAEAVSSYRQSLARDAASIDAHFQLGAALHRLGRHSEALAELRQVVHLNPLHGQAHHDLGLVLMDAGDINGAIMSLRRAAQLLPDTAETWCNLGLALRKAGNPEEAKRHMLAAIALKPDYFEARNNIGNCWHDLGQLEEAASAYRQALNLRPDSAESLINLGRTLNELNRWSEADAAFGRAIEISPQTADAHWNYALALLARGRFSDGWREYGWRWQSTDFPAVRRPFSQPAWDGSGVGTGALLVWGEQGVGDEVLYASMIPDLVARGLRVVVETDSRLVPLLTRSFPKAAMVARRTPPDLATVSPEIRAQTAMGDLGRWLRAAAANFPKTGGYLMADPARVAEYRKAMGHEPVVGLSWTSTNAKIGVHKSTALQDWAPILQTPGVTFVNLQYGDTAAERGEVEAKLGVKVRHLAGLDLRDDLDGLAALITACDLVITVSNTTAHLAGALAVPTWVIIPVGAGQLWYWGTEGITSLWHPSATLFRQKTPGNWRGVLEDLALKLRNFRPLPDVVTTN